MKFISLAGGVFLEGGSIMASGIGTKEGFINVAADSSFANFLKSIENGNGNGNGGNGNVPQYVTIYDTTLRDGAQSPKVNFLVEDKLRIADKLAEIGVDIIEGGWPSSNPTDLNFFKEIKNCSFASKISVFGSTAHPANLRKVQKDENLKGLINVGFPNITIFGKTWDFHAKSILNISLEDNLRLIAESIKFLIREGCTVTFDAEHFFDGYKSNEEYALRCILTARDAGAKCIVLCDTNGGTLPFELSQILQNVVRKVSSVTMGIHCHNDSGCAVANSLLAMSLGVVSHIQGTINGLGERCGNADLCSIVPAINLKMQGERYCSVKTYNISEIARFVYELTNLAPDSNQPYVGEDAFTHKGGIHASAMQIASSSYQHIDPTLVGNKKKIIVSDLSGKSNLASKIEENGWNYSQDTESLRKMVKAIKAAESKGYVFEAADGSLELLLQCSLGYSHEYFRLLTYRVIVEKRERDLEPINEATILLEVNKDKKIAVDVGDGPVNALDKALRAALIPYFPSLNEIKLIDYKVRIITNQGSASIIRVLIEFTDGKNKWGTVGVSSDIVAASCEALVDSIRYKLMKDKEREESSPSS